MTAADFTEKTATRYWAYRNWTLKRARFHRADCRHCNDGHGKQGVTGERSNDEWHGPFGTPEAAQRYVESLGWEDVGPCGFCL